MSDLIDQAVRCDVTMAIATLTSTRETLAKIQRETISERTYQDLKWAIQGLDRTLTDLSRAHNLLTPASQEQERAHV